MIGGSGGGKKNCHHGERRRRRGVAIGGGGRCREREVSFNLFSHSGSIAVLSRPHAGPNELSILALSTSHHDNHRWLLQSAS